MAPYQRNEQTAPIASAERIPPQALDVERTVLGSMLIDGQAAAMALELCDESCFYMAANRHIFNCMREMFEKNIPIDIVTLADMLRKQFAAHPLRSLFPPDGGLQNIEAQAFYGPGYQDVQHRRPSIRQAEKILGWKPKAPFERSLEQTLDYFLKDVANCQKEETWSVSAFV